MNAANLIGQTLDAKYQIERELGRGGMGAVYLATHLGTERAVALKVIAPEFMRREEFVERFRREARAAGRLRHPNVVDVTDFGLAETEQGRVAYLVMEYLDGCTLGEVLEEEKRLPLSWTLDILEQACSAVAEAHRQGIIHRDLKPDNIWLEPNSRGGYTVKVLDFGIAKLEEPMDEDETANSEQQIPNRFASTRGSKNQTAALAATEENTMLDISPNRTPDFAEDATLHLQIQDSNENGTAIFPAARATVAENANVNQDAAATQLLSAPTANERKTFNGNSTSAALTRVGAVLGTPLYMSPEQCRGEHLDPRADVYSLGVIAYQMLSGSTPFTGNFTEVIKAHQETQPPPLEAKKLRRRVKKTIHSALAKNADERPISAVDFSSKLRASSEGIGALLRRALVIYSEHLPTFLWLSFVLQLPSFLITLSRIIISFLRLENVVSATAAGIASAVLGFLAIFVGIFFASILLGVTTWIVAQLLAVPLRPVDWKKALEAARSRWRGFAGTVTIVTIVSFTALIVGLLPGSIMLGINASTDFSGITSGVFLLISLIVLLAGFSAGVAVFVLFYLVSPVVMMENLRGRQAVRRSATLIRRSVRTAIAAFSLSFLAPLMMSAVLMIFVSALIKSNDIFIVQRSESGFNIRLRDNSRVSVGTDIDIKPNEALPQPQATPETEEEKRFKKSFNEAVFEAIFQTLWFPILILLSSLTSVITGLLYLKSRQSGGESLGELLTEFEENDRTQKHWQLRLKEKLVQSGRHTSRNVKKSGVESRES
jgi:serine/threonine protein kinase